MLLCEFFLPNPKCEGILFKSTKEVYESEILGYDILWFSLDNRIHLETWTLFDTSWFNYKWLNIYGFNRKKEYKDRVGVFFNEKWLDFEGYDIRWFKGNFHRNGTLFDADHYDKDWLGVNGFNWKREYKNEPGVFFDERGVDSKGFNEKWFKGYLNKNGTKYDDKWYSFHWRDNDWYDKDWLDKNGFNRKREYQNKSGIFFNEKWYNYLGNDRNWFSDVWMHISWVPLEQYIVNMLHRKAYKSASDLYYNRENVYRKFLRWEFQELVRDQVKKYIKEYSDFYTSHSPNDEQIDVIADMSQYLLVQARAGCGKTTAMKWKIHFLIHELWITRDQIICLAFNTDVANEMKEIFITEEIRKDTEKYKNNLINAFTFHRLAYKIANGYGIQNDFNDSSHVKKIPHLDDIIAFLADKDQHNIPQKAKERIVSLYAHEIQTSENDPHILIDTMREDNIELILTCLREEDWDEFKERDEKIVQPDYHETRWARSHRREWANEYKALKWHTVKSLWEKYIADFLFEHNIEYKYEPWITGYLGKWDNWKADFKIYPQNEWEKEVEDDPFSEVTSKDQVIIIELWWVDDSDLEKTDHGGWSIREKRDYLVTKKKKVEYMKKHENLYKFIEFSNREVWDLPKKERRKKFEAIIKERLEKNWIICEKLSDKELYQNFDEKSKTNIEKLIRSFINRSKQRRYSIEDMKSKIWKYETCRELFAFYKFAIRCYEAYQYILELNSQPDFNDCIVKPIEEWERCKKLPQIINWHTGKIHLSELKYLIVDEFQDVSEIFYQLISTIKTSNPKMNIVCVGDDWQAINGFAWSEQKYIENFSYYFENGQKLLLNNTQRCSSEITDIVEKFTKGAVTMKHVKEGGKILGKKLEDVFIKNDTSDEDQEYYLESIKKSVAINFARMSKGIVEWLLNNQIKWGTYFVLSRRWDIYSIDHDKGVSDHITKIVISEYEKREGTKLDKKTKEIIEKRIHVMTAHKSKWKTADMVFIVWHGEDWLKIHPNTKFGSIFWDTESSVLDEEKRLYYVALTRARSQIYFFSADPVNNAKDDIIYPQRKDNTTSKSHQTQTYGRIENANFNEPI